MRASQTILIIDDEDIVRDVVRAMLERLGFNILEAKTGLEAINLAKDFEGEIFLSILDVGLPDIEGPQLYPLIMEIRPDMKILLCSGYSLDGPIQKILNAGVEGFIKKPFTMAELSEKLKKTIGDEQASFN